MAANGPARSKVLVGPFQGVGSPLANEEYLYAKQDAQNGIKAIE